MRVLILVEYYLPGYNAGGPIRTVSNLVENLGDRVDFAIVTKNRDLGARSAYPSTTTGVWHAVGKAQVLYLPHVSIRRWVQLLDLTPHDILYLNSAFSPAFTLRPLLVARYLCRSPKPVVIAPRGEYSVAALSLRSTKKRIFLRIAKRLNLFGGVIWQASSEFEVADIRRVVGPQARIEIAENMPTPQAGSATDDPFAKEAGQLRLVFLSRIARVKNLDGALRILASIDRPLVFNIYGPLEDRGYWDRCQQLIRELPEHIQVEYHGPLPNEAVASVLREHHLLFLPTHGENYGHVIAEALAAGCPVLISDNTPWTGLEEKGVGWEIPLSDVAGFQVVLRSLADMTHEAFARLSRRAQAYGRQLVRSPVVLKQNEDIFRQARAAAGHAPDKS
jgi:glycosyltransferase involved in cell wall biosynthesis